MPGHCRNTDVERAADFFARLAGDHERKDFSFPFRQRLQPGFEFIAPLALHKRLSVDIQGPLDALEQKLPMYRFLDKVHSARLHRVHCRPHIPDAGQKDDRNVDSGTRQFLLQADSTQPRQPHVEQHAAWTRILVEVVFEELFRRPTCERTQSSGGQCVRQHVADVGVIVDDEYGGLVWQGSAREPFCGRSPVHAVSDRGELKMEARHESKNSDRTGLI